MVEKLITLLLEYLEVNNETHSHSKFVRQAEIKKKILTLAENVDDKLINLTQRTNKY